MKLRGFLNFGFGFNRTEPSLPFRYETVLSSSPLQLKLTGLAKFSQYSITVQVRLGGKESEVGS